MRQNTAAIHRYAIIKAVRLDPAREVVRKRYFTSRTERRL